MNKFDTIDGLEKEAEALSLELADKLEKNEISLEDMARDIDNFLMNQKDGNI